MEAQACLFLIFVDRFVKTWNHSESPKGYRVLLKRNMVYDNKVIFC